METNGEIKMSETKIRLSLIIASGLLLLAAQNDASANTVNFKSTFSGSTTTAFFSFDGVNLAAQGLADGEQNPGGRFTLQSIGQDAPDGQTCTVPGGTPSAGTEFTLVGEAAVLRFEPTGDLLYNHDTSRTTCIDFSSGTPPFPFVGSSSGVITGGTGKYAGATGSHTASSSGFVLPFRAPVWSLRLLRYRSGHVEYSVSASSCLNQRALIARVSAHLEKPAQLVIYDRSAVRTAPWKADYVLQSGRPESGAAGQTGRTAA